MARKKIIDIRPPQKGSRASIDGSRKEEKRRDQKANVGAVLKKNQAQARQKDSKQFFLNKFLFSELSPKKFLPVFSLRKKILFLLPLFALIGIYFLSASYSRATVEIWPKTEEVSFSAKITLDEKIKKVNPETAAILPAEIKEKEKVVKGNFPTTGRISKETKAGGIITVYNNYSPSYQVLVQNTRFVSSEGRLFRTVEKVMIPGGKYENGKLKAGEINIRVIADAPGEDYNIGPDTFSIPGFAGTDRYTKFYGKSFEAFTGGAAQIVSVATAADLNTAEETLAEQAKEGIEHELKSDLTADNVASVYNFLEKSIQTEIIEKKSSLSAGDEAQEFTTEVKVRSKILLFKKEDIRIFAKNHIVNKIPEGKKIHEPSLSLGYTQESSNVNAGTAQVSLKISALTYSAIDEKAVKNNVSQRSLSEIKTFLSNQPEIKNVVVKMWPFWLARVPEDIERISLKVSFDAAD